MDDNETISPTPLIPNHNLALAYVMIQIPRLLIMMTTIRNGLILLQFGANGGFCQQGLSPAALVAPLLKVERVAVYEVAGAGEGEAHFKVSLPERLRERHFEIEVDRSVCRGKVRVNGEEVVGGNLDEVFRFDRSNSILVTGCLERKPDVVSLWAYPKVFIAAAKARLDARKSILDVEVTIRNTLLNSVSCSLMVQGHSEEFFVGPETSQTRSFFVRLKERQQQPLTFELYKYPESMEGAYRQIQSVIPTRIQP